MLSTHPSCFYMGLSHMLSTHPSCFYMGLSHMLSTHPSCFYMGLSHILSTHPSCCSSCSLDTNFIVKISDGALSHEFYPECYHAVYGAIRPVRWAAIETLQEGLCSSQSNVVSDTTHSMTRLCGEGYMFYMCCTHCLHMRTIPLKSGSGSMYDGYRQYFSITITSSITCEFCADYRFTLDTARTYSTN